MAQHDICIDPFAAPTLRETTRPAFGIRTILAAFRAWRERRDALRHLRQMDDRQLRDIGINRYDLPPSVQDDLISGRDGRTLLSLFPHSIIVGLDANRRKSCD